jgi:hypothetical protein
MVDEIEKEFTQRLNKLLYMKAYTRTPSARIHQKEYRQAHKEYRIAYGKTYFQSHKAYFRAWDKVRNKTPKRKAWQKAFARASLVKHKQSPQGRA